MRGHFQAIFSGANSGSPPAETWSKSLRERLHAHGFRELRFDGRFRSA